MTSMSAVTKEVQDVPIHVCKQHPIMESVSIVLEVILVTLVMWQVIEYCKSIVYSFHKIKSLN